MTDLITTFMGDPVPDSEIVDTLGEKLQIGTFSPAEATEGEARKLHKELLQSAANFMYKLREIHDRKAFKALGFGSFEAYLASLRSRSFDPININYQKFRRLCIHDDVCDYLRDRDIDTRNLLPTHTELMHKELPETQWLDCWERIMVHKRAYVPTGEALRNWHEGKILSSFVQSAIDDIKHRLTQALPDDPYAEEDATQGNVEPAEAIFDATDDGRIVVDEALVTDAPEWVRPITIPVYAEGTNSNTSDYVPLKPAPVGQKPPAPVMPNSDKSQFEDEKEICLAFVGVEPHAMDDDVLWVQGTDGPNVYTIPVRKSALRGME